MTEKEKEILNDLLANVSDDIDKRTGSVIYTALAPAAIKLAELENENNAVLDEAYADTASLDNLILKAKERRIEYHDATKAIVEAVINLSDGDSLEGGERFFTQDGKVKYRVVTVSDDGSIYQLECEDYGTGGNIENGQLVFDGRGITVISAEIIGIFEYGRDAETKESLLKRYDDSFNVAAFGGNKTDYREKCLESVNGVGGVQVRRAWNGGGTVKLVIVGLDYGAVSDEIVNAAQELFDPIVDGVHTGEGVYSVIGHTVTVCSADEVKINIATTIEYENETLWSDVADNVKTALREYLSTVCKTWAENGRAVVRISKIESIISSVSGVVDAYDTTINSSPSNVIFDGDGIPVLGTVNGL